MLTVPIVRDASGKNLVHLALVSKNGVQQYDAEILVQLLDLIDKRLLPGMFSERCSDAPSGLTPIALWINKHPAEGKGSREVLKTMLDRMGTEPLHMMDGSGQFPTHICVRNGSFEILEMIFERYPELAFWENAMGQTPIELAELLYIRNRTADPPSQHSNYNHNPSGGNYGKPSAPSEPNVVRVHELCKRMAKEHSDEKRVLVSVLQASEVAKRLAEQKRNDGNDNNGYYRRRYDRYGNQKTDEVEQWYNNNYWY